VANFAPNTYAIRFDASDGIDAPTDQPMTYGTAGNLSSAGGMTKAGFTFLGWSRTQGAITADYADGESVKNLATGEEGSESVTLYAVWASNSEVVLSYAADDAFRGFCSPVSESATIGANAVGSTATARTGYHFVNWTPLGSTTSLSTDLTY
ncbi:MAG: InlB B-repeat-containing protein, partial [Atopobiaceae bacterium]|nr:InlB B-repeat-containing protein [Atopobiaceae bacterium]